MIELCKVSKSYSRGRKAAVTKVSFSVAAHEVVGLVGLNGAGKSTTLRVACGASLPDEGDTVVDGVSLRDCKSEASRLIGWVPEQPTHDPSSRVSALVSYYSDIAGGVSNSTGENLLVDWGLADHETKKFRELSLGLKKRLAIVVASLTSPKYFLLDEPFNGLDPLAIAQFRDWIIQSKERGAGLLLSSHNLNEVQSLCDRIQVIHHGRIIASLESSDLARSVTSTVKIRLDRMDENAIGILGKFGELQIFGDTALVKGTGIDTGLLSVSISKAGYVIRELARAEGSLEEYFLKLVGEDS